MDAEPPTSNESGYCNACVGQITACNLANAGERCQMPGHEGGCFSAQCGAPETPCNAARFGVSTQEAAAAAAAGNNTGGNIRIGDPPQGNAPDTVPVTPFAPPYKSIHTLNAGNRLRKNLGFVNCSYLSTPGLAPTLTQLKQHAQALTILIKSLTVSTSSASINNAASGAPGAASFNDGEAFDWLNDLTKPYLGPANPRFQMNHDQPLHTLINQLQLDEFDGQMKVQDICPLHTTYRTPVNGKSLPYATHQALIEHANEVLELLDHEYSAKGGFLAILPEKSEKEDREKAEATLLGQFILYAQRLVQRVHDLERLYANAMDALAGEANVPLQALSKLGPHGRQPRELVYPQDRFVLVNAGDDVFQFLNSEFEKKERIDEKIMQIYMGQGVAGEALWRQRDGKEYSRGITAIDITTRYYRLRNDHLKTIFVIPAYEKHPGTKVTRSLETVPTVVAVVKPVWPERQSTWELKNRAQLDEGLRAKVEAEQQAQEIAMLQNTEKVLLYDVESKAVENEDLKIEIDQLKGQLNADDVQAQLIKCKADWAAEREKYEKEKDDAVKMAAEALVQAERDALAQERRDQFAAHNNSIKILHQERTRMNTAIAARTLEIERIDREQAEIAHKIAEGMKKAYEANMHRVTALLKFLEGAGEKIDLNTLVIPKGVFDGTEADAKAQVEKIMIAQGYTPRADGDGSNSPPPRTTPAAAQTKTPAATPAVPRTNSANTTSSGTSSRIVVIESPDVSSDEMEEN